MSRTNQFSLSAVYLWQVARHLTLCLAVLTIAHSSATNDSATAESDSPVKLEHIEHFEKVVRPVLAEHCFSCHGPETQKAGLRLDHVQHMRTGGESGPALVPGDASASAIVQAIRYEADSVQMPPTGKLSEDAIAAISTWIEQGAPWPADQPVPDVSASNQAGPGSEEWQARLKHWSLQAIQQVAIPQVGGPYRIANPIDALVTSRFATKGWEQAPRASSAKWLRRVSYDLVGLPPTPEELAAFTENDTAITRREVVDRLLDSPGYGERWGRHWLDLVRYAESAGHEFDYDIPFAYQYRDYVIRAFNADVPYDQFVREHLAGDLLPQPRLNMVTGQNESIVGTTFFWLGQGKHSPVDVRVEECDTIDNQIDVFGKAFQGLTIACARCHDHKFDAIATADYYALAGFLQSSRQHLANLMDKRNEPVVKQMAGVVRDSQPMLSRNAEQQWKVLAEATIANAQTKVTLARAADSSQVSDDRDLTTLGHKGVPWEGWFFNGWAFQPAREQLEVFLESGGAEGPCFRLQQIGTLDSGRLSRNLTGAARTPTFPIDRPFLDVLVARRGGEAGPQRPLKRGQVNLIIDGFQFIQDPLYGKLSINVPRDEPARWFRIPLDKFQGQTAYLEILDEDHGAISLYAAKLTRSGSTPPMPELNQLAGRPLAELSASEIAVANSALSKANIVSDGEIQTFADATSALVNQLSLPEFATVLVDGTPEDEAVLLRGSPRKRAAIVPRRYLAAFDAIAQPIPTQNSGRLELANQLLDERQPLTARVIANRVWLHHFGRGIVPTPDDFGQMGVGPSNPELLDYLAWYLVNHKWSLKSLHRHILESETYAQGTLHPNQSVKEEDPENIQLARMPLRRLEAEAIRDAQLFVAGRLNREMFGPSVPIYLTSFLEGRGRPGISGPIDGHGRRSIYQAIRRNFLPAYLAAFDYPSMLTCNGRRLASNVPAQALVLLNSPLVQELAGDWAKRNQTETVSATVTKLYLTGFGREPLAAELVAACQFLEVSDGEVPASSVSTESWTSLAHVLMNTKEFIYIE
jgi:cytochrome c553